MSQEDVRMDTKRIKKNDENAKEGTVRGNWEEVRSHVDAHREEEEPFISSNRIFHTN